MSFDINVIARSLRNWLSPEFYSEADIHKMALSMKESLESEQHKDVEPEYKSALAKLLNEPSVIDKMAVAINDGDDLSHMPKVVQEMMRKRVRDAIRIAMTPTDEIEDLGVSKWR